MKKNYFTRKFIKFNFKQNKENSKNILKNNKISKFIFYRFLTLKKKLEKIVGAITFSY